jgi:TolB-like protein/Tfp pilus assembly protein PilF
MSRVFVAEEHALERKVVVKVLPPEMAAGVSIERFKREIMLAARLQHPHIVPVLAAGGSAGLPYFTMPFVDGESLRARLERQGELPVSEAIRMLREIASALAYAHERGIVHRDIKPDNVLLSGGAAMVTDFGVAKAVSASATTSGGMTSLGIALGTPAYMSPEQASADPSIDQRADIYSFGALAYEMLTGHPLFTGRSPQALLAAHATEAPEPVTRRRASVNPALASLVMRCLEKRPADRPQSAGEIVRALDDIAASGPSGGGTATSAAGTNRLPGASKVRVGIAVVVLAGTAALGAWAFAHRSSSTPAAAASIAVLPFDNAGGDTAMAFFADGMTEELATALSHVGIRVAARSSVATAQARHLSDRDASKLLGVQMLLHSSVRRAGQRLRVWTQLVNGQDGIALWTRTYDTTLTDVFHVQDDLAQKIAAELEPSLSGRVATSAQSVRGTNDRDAYDFYLRARYYNDRLDALRAISYADSAISRDPEYARAYALLARAYSSLSFLGSVSMDSIGPQLRRAAQRALELGPNLAEARAAMGSALAADNRFADAEAEMKRGLAIEPDNVDLHLEYCAALFESGRPVEALAEAKRARALDPLSVGAIALEQYTLEMLGRFDEARAVTRAGLELDPTFVALYQNAGTIEAFAGHSDSALALIRKGYDLDPTLYGNSAMLLFGYATAGRWNEADRVRTQIEREGGGNSPDFFKAITAIVYGDRSAAAAAVARGVSARQPLFLFVSAACDPMFGSIKSERAYVDGLTRNGMRSCPPVGRWPIQRR